MGLGYSKGSSKKMAKVKKLTEIAVGEGARVFSLADGCAIKTRLADLGVIPGTEILCVGKSPLGDPRAYLIRGAVIAIRNRDARYIIIY